MCAARCGCVQRSVGVLGIELWAFCSVCISRCLSGTAVCTLGSRVSQGNIARHCVPGGTRYRDRALEKQSRGILDQLSESECLFPLELTSKIV